MNARAELQDVNGTIFSLKKNGFCWSKVDSFLIWPFTSVEYKLEWLEFYRKQLIDRVKFERTLDEKYGKL